MASWRLIIMSDFNRVILLGRLGNDPELKTSSQGVAYMRLSIATHSFKGGSEKTTHWHRVMVFGSQAQLCSTYLKKGSPLLVEGYLEVRTYTNKEGHKTSSVSVIANRVQFLGGRLSTVVEDERSDVSAHQEEAQDADEYGASDLKMAQL
jgi:single-strand DNA-binding protein